MRYYFPEPICPECGSAEATNHNCRHDEDLNWRTREELRADPGIKIPNAQRAMWVSDPTYWTCPKCGYEFSQEEIKNVIRPQIKALGPVQGVREEIGIGVANLEAVRKLELGS